MNQLINFGRRHFKIHDRVNLIARWFYLYEFLAVVMLEVVSTLEENIANVRMGTRILGPTEELPMAFGLGMSVEVLTFRERLIATLASRFRSRLFRMTFFTFGVRVGGEGLD